MFRSALLMVAVAAGNMIGGLTGGDPAARAHGGRAVPAAVGPAWQVVAPRRPPPLFHHASGIAFGPGGDLYLADSAEGRVKKFTPGGRPVATYGTDAPGPLHWYPRGITAGGRAVYLLADGITALSGAGRFLAHWYAPGATAIAAGGAGNVFALSTEKISPQASAGRIDKYSPTGELLSTWHTGPIPSDASHAVQANGIAVDPRGNLVVTVATADNSGRQGPLITSWLYRVSWAGTLTATVHGSEKAPLGPVEAVDGQGNAYLTPDVYAGALGIEKLSPSGRLLARWTSAGGTTYGAELHLALLAGRLYVTDTHDVTLAGITTATRLVHVLNAAGKQIAQWGTVQRIVPVPFGLGIAAGPRGTIYTTIAGQNVFASISADGRTIHLFGHTSARPPVFDFGPSAIAVGGNGNVFVLDGLCGCIDKFTPAGTFLHQWRLLAPGHGSLFGLAIDRAGAMYTIRNGQIVKVSQSGALLGTFGPAASEPLGFGGALALALDAHGTIYVADTYRNTVVKLSPAGAVLGTIGSAATLDRPGAVAVGPSGHVYVLDTTHSAVMDFAPGGSPPVTYGVPGVLAGQLSGPTGLAVSGQSLDVLDYGNNRIQRLTLPRAG